LALPINFLRLSSFMRFALYQINSALYASTPNSIVILDEFGNGTSEVSGLSLLAAVLSNFIERDIYCPHIFVATHMHRVINLLPQSPIIEEQVKYASDLHLFNINLFNRYCHFDFLFLLLFFFFFFLNYVYRHLSLSERTTVL